MFTYFLAPKKNEKGEYAGWKFSMNLLSQQSVLLWATCGTGFKGHGCIKLVVMSRQVRLYCYTLLNEKTGKGSPCLEAIGKSWTLTRSSTSGKSWSNWSRKCSTPSHLDTHTTPTHLTGGSNMMTPYHIMICYLAGKVQCCCRKRVWFMTW